MVNSILIAKLLNDAGFDVELGRDRDWLKAGVPGTNLVAWVRADQEGYVVALSQVSILAELGRNKQSAGPLPSGAVGAHCLSGATAVVDHLARARVLERTLPNALLNEFRQEASGLDTTEAVALVRQRRGQEIFRRGLMEYWQGRCAITGLDIPELLRASHAKPWKDSTNAERLDVHNGLLLSAHLDAAFDQGFITMDNEGRLLLSPALSASAIALLGLEQMAGQVPIQAAHCPYLAWHRQHVFRTKTGPATSVGEVS